MVRGKSVRNHPPAMQLLHAFSVCSCDFLAQYSMNSYVYPTGFGRCSFGCSAGPCRRRTGFGTTYGQTGRPVWGKDRACRTHMYGRLLDHARLSQNRREAISESYTCSRPRTGPKIIEKSYKPAARSSTQTDQGFSLCA